MTSQGERARRWLAVIGQGKAQGDCGKLKGRFPEVTMVCEITEEQGRSRLKDESWMECWNVNPLDDV